MKEYRLIKKYPNSNEIGYTSVVDYSDYPEFYEEIKQEFKTINFNSDGTKRTILRLSDMHHLSVGDWFYPRLETREPNIILGFEYCLNGEFRVKGSNCYVPLSSVIPTKDKAKQYTVDGVKLYSWDKVWGVSTKFKKVFIKYGREEDGIPVYEALKEFYKNVRWFVSMEEAEDFILMNKPCLALVDILDSMPKSSVNYFKKIANERTQNK